MNYTIVWEYIGGDAHVTPVTIKDTPERFTEYEVLQALGEDETSDIAIIAIFSGHRESVWGAAINE